MKTKLGTNDSHLSSAASTLPVLVGNRYKKSEIMEGGFPHGEANRWLTGGSIPVPLPVFRQLARDSMIDLGEPREGLLLRHR